MSKKIVYGWAPSKLDGSEQEFNSIQNFNIPEEYSFVNYLPAVEDQGDTNMCVTYSLTAHLDWNYNVDHAKDNKSFNHINKDKMYSIRSNKYEDAGMTFKEALNFLKKTGVPSDHGLIKIERYMKINSFLALKQALLLNGPCVAGLFVKDPYITEFWNGSQNLGGHAVAIVGYNKEGFIIRNSWGTSYGNNGYSILKYKDFNKVIECWTIID